LIIRTPGLHRRCSPPAHGLLLQATALDCGSAPCSPYLRHTPIRTSRGAQSALASDLKRGEREKGFFIPSSRKPCLLKKKEKKRRKKTCNRVFERLRLGEHNLRAQSLEHVLLLLSCAACITLTTSGLIAVCLTALSIMFQALSFMSQGLIAVCLKAA